METAIDLFVSGAAGLSPPLSSSGAFVTSPAAPIPAWSVTEAIAHFHSWRRRRREGRN